MPALPWLRLLALPWLRLLAAGLEAALEAVHLWMGCLLWEAVHLWMGCHLWEAVHLSVGGGDL